MLDGPETCWGVRLDCARTPIVIGNAWRRGLSSLACLRVLHLRLGKCARDGAAGRRAHRLEASGRCTYGKEKTQKTVYCLRGLG